ncbi:MAG: hypothetical protein E6J09_01060 [Chloroflexi bacterium]|nr:MAG: hypothetical protein E6J09_01060 [Chloroflexota bacterium]
MSDERQDDEILGRALSRAIETIELNETPYEESRMLTVRARRRFGTLQFAGLVAAIGAAVAIGTWLNAAREGTEAGPVAASPPSSTPAATQPTFVTAMPRQTATPTVVDRSKIYLGRLGLPPVAVSGPELIEPRPEDRIASRITGLRAYRQTAAPQGLTNYLWNNSFQGGVAVAVAADLAKVDLLLEKPFVAGDHSEALAILQQLVYTATEEPGIRRVLLTENGGQPLAIGDIRADKPLAREDVLAYSFLGPVGKDQGIAWAGNDTIPHVVAQLGFIAIDGTTAGLQFRGEDAAGTAELPSFSIELEPNDDTKPAGGKSALNGGKYVLNVSFQWNGGGSSGGVAGTSIFDQTPVRAIVSANPLYQIELDDARPWRAYMPDKTRLVVEIGGDPRATSERIAVTAPKPGDRTTGQAQFAESVRLAGGARVFEATVSWRVRDATGKIVATSHFNATLGSSSLWGTFDSGFAVPASVHGSITLEVFEVSAQDGSDRGTVKIPLTVP